jgi:uncharacterized membrane protein SpoIIM required for sporulation
VTALVSSDGLQLSSRRFREARQGDWERLETLIGQIERGRAGQLDDEDLFELPVLYRATLSSLSVARETSLDADLVSYLEALSTRAYFILYGVHAPLSKRIVNFFAYEWPASVRAIWRETWVSVALMVAGAIAAYLLVRSDAGWFYAIIPGELAAGRDPSAGREQLRAALYSGGERGGLAVFATSLFTHNSQVAIMSFALGFAFAVPTVLLILYNGCMLGAFLAVFVPKGLGLNLAAWLAIHGTTELFAISLAGAAGMRIGMAVAFPGRQTRLNSAITAGRTSANVMFGVVLMLVVAGLLEGIGRQTINDDIVRALIGGGALLLWLLYFYVMPLRDRSVDNG